MTNTKKTKRALLSSVLALFLCFAMLLGTTFAWFTDRVDSGYNTIIAGNLDIELYHTNQNTPDRENVNENTKLFTDVTYWEPGVMVWEKFDVVNAGKLDLKYQFTLNVQNATEVEGVSFADMLRVAVVDDQFDYTRVNAEAIGDWQTLKTFTLPETLLDGETDTFGVVIWWEPSDIDNIFNMNNGNTTQVGVDIGVTLIATQLNSEADGFNNSDYDKDAWMDGMKIFSAQDLQAAINAGETELVLESDIELSEPIVIPAPATTYSLRSTAMPVKLDLNGKNITLPQDIANTTYAIQNLGNLVLMDSVGGGSVNARGIYNGYDGENTNPNATLTVLSGTYNALGTDGGAAVYNYGSVEILGGTFTSNGGYALNNNQGGTMTVDNASVTGGIYNIGELTVDNSDVYQHLNGKHGIYNTGTVQISGGSFDTVANNELIKNSGGEVTIDGGIFTQSAKSYLMGGPGIVINDGTFNGYADDKMRPDAAIVYGGTFNFDVADWCADGYQSVNLKNGTHFVYEGEALVEFDEGNLIDIVNKAEDGAVILIESGEYETTQIIVDNKSLTFVGVGDVKIIGKQLNEHVFQLRNGTTGNANENMTVSFQNLTIGGTYKSAIMVRNDLDVKLEDVVFNGTYNWSTLQVENSYDSESKFDGVVNINAVNVTSDKVTMAADDERVTNFNYTDCDFAMIEVQNLGGEVYLNDDKAITPSYNYYVDNIDELQSVLNNAGKGNNVINLTSDINGDVIVDQKDGVNIVINGREHQYDGTIEIYGHARSTGAETLTIKNINFITDEAVDFIHCNTTESDKRYAHNVIVDGCTFTAAEGIDAVGLRMRQCYNITVKNSTFSDMHSASWSTGGDNIVFDNVTVTNCKNGISFGTTTNVVVKNSRITAVADYGYGIRVNASVVTSLTVENNTINADAPILLRAASGAYTATLTGNTLNGKNNDIIVTAADYEEGKILTQATGDITVTIDGKTWVANAKGLARVVANEVTDVSLFDGEYDVYGCGGKTLTIRGSKNAVIKLYNDGEDGCDYAFGSAGTGIGNITFNGITIDTTANTGNYKGFAYMKGTFNDCNFVGAYSLNNDNDFVFNRCTFDFKNGYFWTWGAKSVTFNACTFNGNSKAILAHGWASTTINVNNCTFAAAEKGFTGAGDNTAAIEIDPAGTNVYTINFTGDNTITENYNGWTRVKDNSTGHIITNPTAVEDADGLETALTNGENIELTGDLTISSNDTSSNSGYGSTGVTVDNGNVFDGNGSTLTVNDANGTWDCAVNPKNGTLQNVTVAGAFRGIFMGSASGDVYIDNVIIKDVVYTFNSDGGDKAYGVYISNSELYGWTSYSDVHKEVVFTNCTFGEGSGYAFCRPYNASVFENCVFEEGFEFDTSKTSNIVFINCRYGDTLITAENAASLGSGNTTFFYNGLNGITIK